MSEESKTACGDFDKLPKHVPLPVNDGGPAFPANSPCGSSWGMSLRDYFAAKASEEDIVEYIPETIRECNEFYDKHGVWPSRQWARYQHADDMLKAREVRRG